MTNTRQATQNKGNRIAFGILIILVSLFCFLCEIHCFGGVGEIVYRGLVGFFGLAAYGYALAFLIIGIAITLNLKTKMHFARALYIIGMLFIAILALQIYSSSSHIVNSNYSEYLLNCYYYCNTAGGMLFGLLAFLLMKAITTVGALIVSCAAFFLMLLIQILPLIKKNIVPDYEDKKDRDKSMGIKGGFFKKKEVAKEVLLLDDVDYPALTDFSKNEPSLFRLDVKSNAPKLSKKIKGADTYTPLEEIKEVNYSDMLNEKHESQISYSQKDLVRKLLFDENTPTDEIMTKYERSANPMSAFDRPSFSSPIKTESLRSRLGVGANDDVLIQDFNNKYNQNLVQTSEEKVYADKPVEINVEEIIPKQEEKLPETSEGKIDFNTLKAQQIQAFGQMFTPKPVVEEPKEVVKPTKVQSYDSYEKKEEQKPVNTGMMGAYNKATNKIEEEKPQVNTEIESDAYEDQQVTYEPQYKVNSVYDLDRGAYKPQTKEVKMPRAFEDCQVTQSSPASTKSYEQIEKERKIKDALSQTPELFDFEKQYERDNALSKVQKPKRVRNIDEQERRAKRLEQIDNTKERVFQPSIENAIEVIEEKEKNIRPYTYPPISLLLPPEPQLELASDFDEKKAAIVRKLQDFNIEAEMGDVIQGPTFTLYKFFPNMPRGKTISQCLSYENDLAMAMRVQSVRMTLIPSEGAVGVEVPNKKRRNVNLIEVIQSQQFRDCKSPAIIIFGQNLFGINRVMTFDKLPHAIVAGATGMGKSCFLNALIVSLLYKSTPDEVRMILIDPKRTEFTVYQGLPNLLLDVIKDADKAIKALNWALQEMDRRQKLFEDSKFRNIDDYNDAMKKSGMKTLYRVVIVIDEFAELISIGKKSVEDCVNRIARLARAAGIHLILATQRPSTDVISGTIKNNFPTRVAFHVSSQFDSKTVLDGAGAEKLLPYGDMLMKQTEEERIQGAFISQEEVVNIVEFIKENNDTVYDETIREAIEKEDVVESEPAQKPGKGDDLPPELFKALEIGIELAKSNGAISISNMQRKMGLGWPKAAKIYDMMESFGFLEVINPIKPKEKKVKISEEELEEFKIANNYQEE